MATVSRWEKERSAWLLARSKPGPLRRRRAELLARRARHLGRAGASAGESALHDDVSERLFVRLLKTDEGSADKLARLLIVPVAYAAVWVLVGGAIAVAAGAYRLLWTASPKIGRLWAWPWAVLAALAAIAGYVLLDHGSPFDVSVWPRYFIVYVNAGLFWTNWLWIQLTLGLLFTSIGIRESGWAGVLKGAALKAVTDKHGEFIKTADKDKVRLDPFAGDAAPVEKVKSAAPVSLSVAEPAFDDDPDGPVLPDEDNDDEPVFDDEEFDQTAGDPR